jgi:hypothetical protein
MCEWFWKNNTCPLCRFEIEEITGEREFLITKPPFLLTAYELEEPHWVIARGKNL